MPKITIITDKAESKEYELTFAADASLILARSVRTSASLVPVIPGKVRETDALLDASTSNAQLLVSAQILQQRNQIVFNNCLYEPDGAGGTNHIEKNLTPIDITNFANITLEHTFILELLCKARYHTDFHRITMFDCTRDTLMTIVTAYENRDKRYFFATTKLGTAGSIVLAFAALLSGLTMGDDSEKSSLAKAMECISIFAAAGFNYDGVKKFSGFSFQGKDGLFSFWGFCSAIAPMVMTFFGAGMVLPSTAYISTILGAIAAVANLYCSSALGYSGLKDVNTVVQDFWAGPYYGHPKDETPKTWHAYLGCGIEIIVYAILAIYLTGARAFEVARWFSKPPTGASMALMQSRPLDASYIGTFVGAYAVNIPEWALFLKVFLKLRMRIHFCIWSEQRLSYLHKHSWGITIASMLITLAFATSFIFVFKPLGKATQEATMDRWFDENWHKALGFLLNPEVAQWFAGVGAGLLPLLGWETISDFFAKMAEYFKSEADVEEVVEPRTRESWLGYFRKIMTQGDSPPTEYQEYFDIV